jgi:hypothetical protein
MTAMRATDVDEATAAALEQSAAEQGVSVAELLAELAAALSPVPQAATCEEDWSEDLARLADYDGTGVSHGVDEAFAEFHAQLDHALAGRK